MDEDPTELNNLANSNPRKMAEMQALFDREARANHVYPLINWFDLFPEFMEAQRQMGLSPGAEAPMK